MISIRSKGSLFLLLFVAALYLFLYIPIFILIIFSFNDDALSHQWAGFTTKWYQELFHSVEVWDALQNSLMVAVSTVALSLIMGSLFIFFGSRVALRKIVPIFYINLAIPEIVLAVGLLSTLYIIGAPLTLNTLIVAHTILGLGYVIPILYGRYQELDKRLIEAAYDLGASQVQVFFSIILPLLIPALIASGILVFIVSLDDFVLSFFCSGGSAQTLPMYIFSMIRAGTSPVVGALSSLLFFASSLLVLLFFSLSARKIDLF